MSTITTAAGDRTPRSRLRAGWPRLPVLILLLFLPAVLAGPIRAVLNVRLDAALALGAIVAALAVAPFARAFVAGDTGDGGDGGLLRELVATGVVAVVGLFAAWLLYNRDFDGLPSMRGPDGRLAVDAGIHMSTYHSFVRHAPNAYEGFVSLYSLWYALCRLPRVDLGGAARVTFVLGLVATAAVPCLVSFAVLRARRSEPVAWLAGAATCLGASLGVQYFLVLPLESFHHTAGFWPQLFGLVPLSCLWLVDVLVRPRLLRVAAILGVAGLYRYTYALNLPDVIAALALLLVLEAWRARAWWQRVLLGGGALACIAASLHAYDLLKPVFNRAGWIVDHDLTSVRYGELAAIGALLATACWRPARAAAEGTGLARAVRFPVALGIMNVVFMRLFERLPPTTDYYLQKYSFHAVVLLASALVVIATFSVATLVHRPGWRTASGVVCAAILAAVAQHELRRGFSIYQQGFHEQAFGKPYVRLNPWLDTGAQQRIEHTLAETHESFGGYLTPYWPMLVFMNSMLEHGDAHFWMHATVTPAPGQCIFWEGDGNYPELDAYPQKRCVSYRQRWTATSRPRTLCSRCD